MTAIRTGDNGVDWRPCRAMNCLVLTPLGDLRTPLFQAVCDDLVAFAMDLPHAIIVVVDELRIGSRDALAVFPSAVRRIAGWPAVPIILVAGDQRLRAVLAARALHVCPTLGAALAELDSVARQRRADIDLLPADASSRRAREFVRSTCQRWGLAGHAPDAMAVATELVENSIIHAGTDLRLRLEPHEGGLVVAVRDSSPLAAVPHRSGRRPGGLNVVAHLADDWGWAPDSTGGKVVWAVLAA